jgi:dihydrofolate synthase/folylpolyglutamate synthase
VPQPSDLTARCQALLAPRLEQRIIPGLERIRGALSSLGHPERRFPSAIVLGTNGKGSTAALLGSVLGAHGLRVGLTTSPHLRRVEERIVVAGEPIAPMRLVELLDQLHAFPDLSYFETLTAAALLEFAARRVDIAVVEAGLGGRWDASRAADPVVALLTNVGTDHLSWLGPTRAHVAAEKAAALSGLEAIVATWDAEVEPVIRAHADPATPLSLASQWASVKKTWGPGSGVRGPERHEPADTGSGLAPAARAGQPGTPVRFAVGEAQGEAVLPLAGGHQLANLTLALAGLAALAKHGLAPAPRADAVAAGIAATRWPGRLDWRLWNGRRLLLDGAHNREAIAVLASALDGLAGPWHLLFSCLDDKPLDAMAALLRPLVTGVTVVPVASPRAMAVDRLAAAFPGCRVATECATALAMLPADMPTLVTGSMRLVAEVLSVVEGNRERTDRT